MILCHQPGRKGTHSVSHVAAECQPRLAVYSLHTRRAVPCRSSAATPGNGLIITPALLYLACERIFTTDSEREIVAAPLTCRTGFECEQNHIGDPLRGQDVASADCGFGRWIE